ncbi:1,4-dihydroxy-2-naphthoateoctaprenyltransferase [Corynebacterium kutscheri]|uniref:1,4-dihydroxy-2-naphthoate octaprenyltransferase n=1 Tax=Corynebacterium kutscheri TaxID=35755 RepID=A0A0F6TCZ4_9CORY|nr:1,4-dihydroxy-2-naphthoate polyprenyltransferase [Corynebacterium kutscheri]AKE40499.1 1,4-dihydroxy-2-naphthoate prenyltransferase [Corynebacterium kutscheri]VEH05081.1 1,4-dihydroxy-2-naphthoateoctaprenyltransferase [Corynebacterium kutscheri]VEH10894.1 1,4-dihydroxy-2-naphthoateoctaprenyltransferase [Corynebacterium kutscheri]VEH80629.1 1,4-dihydroxy-2-naphthoateoctaprenyltransferase [Corynebacterium kutscheri]
MSEESLRPTFKHWLEGTRPHTWANAFAPVIVGSGTAAIHDGFVWWKAILAAFVSWALIVGVNYANDYSDGIRGTDTDRSGPLRLTGSGIAQPTQVKRAAFIAFSAAGVAGIVLSISSNWWLIAVGLLCVLAAWFYTGGKNPYGYRGLGEVAVFIFFGLVAVMGTQFTQLGSITREGLLAAIAIGSMSAGVNLVNNLRDIPTDTVSGKITLAVRLGDKRTRILFLFLITVPFIVTTILLLNSRWNALGYLYIPLVFHAAQPVCHGKKGKALIPVLGKTGRAMVVWAIASSIAFFVFP